jgi:hypothetical protein
MAVAAARHFVSSEKSRNVVVAPTPPIAAPLLITITNINVHMALTPGFLSKRTLP